MKMKEDSSFLQGVESRLDSLFAEDAAAVVKKTEENTPRSETAMNAQPESITTATDPESPVMSTPDTASADKPLVFDPPLAQKSVEPTEDKPVFEGVTLESRTEKDEPEPSEDKSSFISEIEKRFSAIFGEDIEEPQAKAPAKTLSDEPAAANTTSPAVEPEEELQLDDVYDEVPSPGAVMSSPLKNIKGVVLSIEWEISDEILEQFEEEINKLYLLYTGDKIILGFLRILRFLGRYIRVRGANSNQESINLLLSVYDHLETVMVSSEMTEVKKHLILLDNVKRYRDWVESTDLETEDLTDKTKIDVEPYESLESLEAKPVIEKPEIPQVQPGMGIDGPEEPSRMDEPFLKLEMEPIEMSEPEVQTDVDKDIADLTVAEKDDNLVEAPAATAVMQETFRLHDERESVGKPDSAATTDYTQTLQNMEPHEAFAFGLEEIKKHFAEEISNIRLEIEALKKGRSDERSY